MALRNSMMLGGLALANGLLVGSAPVGQSRAAVNMASIADSLAGLQGPEIFWGSEGPLQNPMKEESDLKGYDGFGSFIAGVKAAGVDLASGEYTVFAPTDEVIADFEFNGGKMTADVVKHHIVKGKVPTSAFSSADLTTVGGGSLQYRRQFRKDFINDATPGVQSEGPSKSSNWPANVECDNGIIHSCNAVLTPDWVDGAGGFNPRGN